MKEGDFWPVLSLKEPFLLTILALLRSKKSLFFTLLSQKSSQPHTKLTLLQFVATV